MKVGVVVLEISDTMIDGSSEGQFLPIVLRIPFSDSGAMVFVAKEIKRRDPDAPQEEKVTSLLSHLLLTRPLPVNPFSAYGRLDCRVSSP